MQKHRHHSSHPSIQRTYPNEADNSYYTQKLLDITTAIASGFGLVLSIVIFTMIM